VKQESRMMNSLHTEITVESRFGKVSAVVENMKDLMSEVNGVSHNQSAFPFDFRKRSAIGGDCKERRAFSVCRASQAPPRESVPNRPEDYSEHG
jgi:hypothetical protein